MRRDSTMDADFVAQTSHAAEKLKFLSFRGALRAEESLILLTLEPREIPRFSRNDKINYFFRSLFSLWVLGLARTNSHRLKPALQSSRKSALTARTRGCGSTLRRGNRSGGGGPPGGGFAPRVGCF